MIPHPWKRFIFRRGYMPRGDFHDVFDRVRARLDETLEPLKRQKPPLRPTLLGGDIPPAEQEEYEAKRKVDNDVLLKESFQLALNVFKEETEAQWDRILDRRAKDWFFAGFIGLFLGYVLGQFL